MLINVLVDILLLVLFLRSLSWTLLRVKWHANVPQDYKQNVALKLALRAATYIRGAVTLGECVYEYLSTCKCVRV